MYARIIGGTLIQLSDTYRDGYSAVIVDEKPEYDRDEEHLVQNYVIEDGEVHQTWRIEEGAEQLSDAEALDIIKYGRYDD